MRACLIKRRSHISTGKAKSVPTQAVCEISVTYVSTAVTRKISVKKVDSLRYSTACDACTRGGEGGRVGTFSRVCDYNNRP